MHFTIPIYGYNDTFVNGFDTKALDWDVLYNAVNIYFDADYFDYIDKEEVKLLDQKNGYVIVMSNVKEVEYCGEAKSFDEWSKVTYIGSIDVHC